VNELPKHPNLFPSEVATFLRISLTTVYDMLQQGIMPAKKIGHQWRIPRDQFVDWFEKQHDDANSLSA